MTAELTLAGTSPEEAASVPTKPAHEEVEVQPHKRTRPKRTRKPKKPTTPTRFTQMGTEIGKRVDQKSVTYGDAFAKAGSFLELLYPNGVKPEQYADLLIQVRIFDKQMRIATDLQAFGESPFADLAGYGLLGMANHEHREACRQEDK